VNDEISEEDFEFEQTTFAKIAEHHHDKLNKLRDNLDMFNSLIDTKFDEIMKQLRQWSGYGESDHLQFLDTLSLKTSE